MTSPTSRYVHPRWVPPGKPVEVHGYRIGEGMVYLGEVRDEPPEARVEASTIDPREAVKDEAGDEGDLPSFDPYRPTYEDMSPHHRAAYLRWLADGRPAEADPGYALLFLYGLERRLLSGLAPAEDPRGASSLVREVERIAQGTPSGSLRDRCQELARTARAVHLLDDDREDPLKGGENQVDLPLEIRLEVGRRIRDGDPISSETGFRYLQGHPEIYLREPAEASPDRFRRLFLHRYLDRHGDGLVVDDDLPPLTVRYRPGNPTLPSALEARVDDLPDAREADALRRTVQALADEVARDLEPVVRYRRRAGDAHDVVGLSLLPEALLQEEAPAPFSELQEFLSEVVDGHAPRWIPIDDLLDPVALPPSGWGPTAARALARLLEHLRWGFEPDPRYGGPPPGRGEEVVVFRQGGDGEAPDPDLHESVRILQHMGIAVLQAGKPPDDDVLADLAARLEARTNLTMAEVRRLEAHRRWLRERGATLEGLADRVAYLPRDARRQVGRFLVDLACQDGPLGPDERGILEEAYGALGLDHGDLEDDLWDLEPDPTRPGVPERDGQVELDPSLLEEKLKDTEEVEAILQEEFADEAPEAEPEPPTTAEGDTEEPADPAESLDARDRGLLDALAEREEWSREEVQALARDHGLLPSAAIERINDALFEVFEAPVIEGGGTVRVDVDRCREVLA